MDNYINLWKVDSQSFLQFKINDIYPFDCITGINQNTFFTGNFNGYISCWKTNKKKLLIILIFLTVIMKFLMFLILFLID